MEESKKEFIICFSSHYGKNVLKPLMEDIKKYSPKKVLYWAGDEWALPGDMIIEDLDNLKDLIIDTNTQLYVLFGSCETEKGHFYKKVYPQENFKILNWPTYFIHRVNYDTNNFLKEFNYLFSNLNYIPHHHRCVLMDELYNVNLFNVGKISWNLIDENYSQYDFKYWKQELIEIDNFIKNKKNFTNTFYETDDSLISIVTESTTRDMFFTEKTFKPIISERPFIVLGYKGQNLELKKYGFELFDEIFNYEFDLSDDVVYRAKGIVQNLQNLKNENYNLLYNKVSEKLRHNKEVALNILENDLFIPQEILEFKNLYKDEFIEGLHHKVPQFFSKYL